MSTGVLCQSVGGLLVALTVWGCGGRHHVALDPDGAQRDGASDAGSMAARGDSLETYMAKVRALSAEARPPRKGPQTIEMSDPELAAAIEAALLRPSPLTYRAAAESYRRIGIFDRAHHYYARALAVDPTDAATHDALARLWRDSGFPHLALTDAHRAVYYAPSSAEARNTLGTILQALGNRALARAEYERAVELDPAAAYALNNLCYGWILDGAPDKAVARCRQALALEPGLTAARNNLALAYAATGDLAGARDAFAAAGDPAAALYNTGIVYLARRQYGSAFKAFADAHALQPSLDVARVRAQQAAAAAAGRLE